MIPQVITTRMHLWWLKSIMKSKMKLVKKKLNKNKQAQRLALWMSLLTFSVTETKDKTQSTMRICTIYFHDLCSHHYHSHSQSWKLYWTTYLIALNIQAKLVGKCCGQLLKMSTLEFRNNISYSYIDHCTGVSTIHLLRQLNLQCV